jgi:hypothetical protein
MVQVPSLHDRPSGWLISPFPFWSVWRRPDTGFGFKAYASPDNAAGTSQVKGAQTIRPSANTDVTSSSGWYSVSVASIDA